MPDDAPPAADSATAAVLEGGLEGGPDGAPPQQAATNTAKLSKLVLQGFKSFQRRTAVPLFQGFNAIIGPNGAGKSNILDGICFVLGRSSRGLRAGRLDQIIYNGGKDSKPADHALVELYLDNSQGQIPNQPAEIVVSRKVSRQGVSVYKINEKTVTREHTVDILRHANIDPDGHNIIQQGDVTAIIEAKPKERREVLDEIAGVREYKEKKDKALKELEVAQKAVDEAAIVMRQKQEFLNKIGRERELALKHQELQTELEKLKASLAHNRLAGVESALTNVRQNLEVKEQELAALSGKVESVDTSLDAKEGEMRSIEREILQKSVNAPLRQEIETLSSETLKKDGQANASEREVGRLRELIALLSSRRPREEGSMPTAVRAILEQNWNGVFGTVAKLCSFDKMYDVAIEVAAGGHMSDIIVDGEQTAIDCINFLKERNLGRVRFLPLDRIRPFQISAKAEVAAKSQGVIDFAVRLVNFDKKYAPAFQYVLGETLVVQNTEAARKIHGVRVVTLEGELFEAGGAIVGGRIFRPGAKQQASAGAKDDIEAQVKDYEETLERLEAEVRQLRSEISELEKQLSQKRAIAQQESGEVRQLEERRNSILSGLEEAKRGRRQQYEQRILMETEVQGLRLQKARLEAEYEGLRVSYEPFREKIEGGAFEVLKADFEKLEREIRRVERQLQQIGLINMRAIEEFEIFKKDYEEWSAKLEQLYAERNSIKAMIEKLEEKRRILFLETLERLSKEFAQVLGDLIGGNAELALENLEDIESGLLIRVQPRGKQLLNIDSLSGGEKSLAAIAFLIAIVRIRPAPFYLLDEVDAMLDKANSERIGELVKRYAVNSQFIVITHNDITARRAERIYGVSMQRGVSQVLGVQL